VHRGRRREVHTVDCDSNSFGQDVAVGAFEAGNLAKVIDLEILLGHTLRRLSMDNLEVDVVGFGDRKDCDCAGVFL